VSSFSRAVHPLEPSIEALNNSPEGHTVVRARLRQERSRQRRDELLEAAVRVFAYGGIRAVTHRAVAAEANLPTASTTYYFSSIKDLVREAIRRRLDAWVDTLENEVISDVDIVDLVDSDHLTAILAQFFAVYDTDDAGVDLALYIQAVQDPELRQDTARAAETFLQRLNAMLVRSGVDDVEPLAAAMSAQLVGATMQRQSGGDDEIVARHLAAALRGLIAAHVLGSAAVDDALGRPAR